MGFCPNCGKEISEDTRFCPDCGQDTKAPARDTKAPAQDTVRSRPSGITIIAIIQGLAGIGALLVGVLMVIVAGVIGTIELPA